MIAWKAIPSPDINILKIGFAYKRKENKFFQ